jgi:hypothetical protein
MDVLKQKPVRLAAVALAFAVVTAVGVLVAYPRMFTGFAVYDDEGYMLIALRSFVEGGALYDEVFSQYGPFYYEAWGGAFSLFGAEVDLDSGRMATLVAWVAASLALGLATLRMTGSALLGLAAQMLVFAALGAVAPNEPMHPGGLIALLLAAIVAVSCAVGPRLAPGGMGLLGASVAALALVKINVGALALAAVVLACATAYPAISGRRWLRLAIEVAFVATPVVLVSAKLGEQWAREYAFHVAVAALAVVVALRARTAGPRRSEELWWLGGGFLAATVAVLLAILGAGTSVDGLLDGVIGQPLRQADAFSIPFSQSNRIFPFDAIALSAALAYWYAARRRPADAPPAWGGGLSLASIAIGVAMALAVIGKGMPFDAADLPGYQLLLLGFAWVALIPAPGRAEGPAAFARLMLPPLAAMQALHAYPVAGSQTLWASFLLIPVGAICVANGVRGLSSSLAADGDRRAALAVGAVVAAFLALFVVETTLRQPLRDYRDSYDEAVPLGLPGAESVRVSPPEAQLFGLVSREIDRRCPTFVMLPGMNSFYFWTDREPPTGYNATGWPTLFDEEAQRHVIEDIRAVEDLCLLENAALAGGWAAGAKADGPLLRHLGLGFRPLVGVGDYVLSRREGPATPR